MYECGQTEWFCDIFSWFDISLLGYKDVAVMSKNKRGKNEKGGGMGENEGVTLHKNVIRTTYSKNSR